LTLEDERLAEDKYREKVAERLRAFAKSGRYSTRQLALKLNVSRYALQGWLYRYPPTAEDCDQVMNFLEEMEQE
ncbi:MAG: hypothetical protein KBA03_03700, partial [Anaerolineaceae bacterium]|nr:hypothetical protein [Anaerolineaceae bacterium]